MTKKCDSLGEKALEIAASDKKINTAVSKAIVIMAYAFLVSAGCFGFGFGYYTANYFWKNKLYENNINNFNN